MPTDHSRARLLPEPFTDVLAAARTGAPWAFERLYATYAPTVAGYLRARGAEDPDAVTNDVFLGVFRGVARFEGDEARFRSWLFAIAHHRMVDDRRRRSRRPRQADLPAEQTDQPGGDVEAEALERLSERRVRALLEQLSPDQRDVLLLRIVGDLTIEQIAEIVGKRPGAVKALQRRGLASLRRLLDEGGVPL